MTAFKAGNQIAFKRLFESTIKEITGITFSKFRWARYEEVEDFVASAYCILYERRQTYNNYKHIACSLITIAQNEGNDYLAHRMAQKKWEKGWMCVSGNYGLNDAIEQEPDQVERVMQAIPALPRLQRRVFELSFFKFMPVSEIARLLQIGEQTARNHRALAIENIRKRLLIGGYRPTKKYVTMTTHIRALVRINRLAIS